MRSSIRVSLLMLILTLTALAGDQLYPQGAQVGSDTVLRVEVTPGYMRFVLGAPEGPWGFVITACDAPPGPRSTGRHCAHDDPYLHDPNSAHWAQIMADLTAYDAAGRDRMAEEVHDTLPDIAEDATSGGGTSSQHRSRGRPLPERILLLAALGGGLLGLLAGRSRRLTGLSVALLGLLGMAWLRLKNLDIVFDTDQLTQRVFFAGLPLTDILTHRYADARHPPLFYVVLHPFVRASTAEWVARLPAALCSLAAVGVWGGLAARALGWLRGSVVVVLLGLSTALLFESREVSDLPLFLLLASVTSLLLVRTLHTGSRRLGIALVAAEAAMFWAYYFAPLVMVPQAALLWLRTPPERRREVLIGAGAVGVLCWPELRRFVWLLREDAAFRDQAEAMSSHIWGALSPGQLLAQLSGLLVPEGWAGLLLIGLVVLGMVRVWWLTGEAKLAGVLSVLWLLFGLTAALIAVSVLRLKAYYLLFLLLPGALLAVLGALSLRDSHPPLRILGGAALGLVIAAAGDALLTSLPRIHHPQQRDDAAVLGAIIKEQGADRVVSDPDYLHTILLFYAFNDPHRRYPGCIHDEEPVRCLSQDGELHTLTSLPRMQEGWEARSVERLAALRDAPLWFVYNQHFANAPLLSVLRQDCREVADTGDLVLFRCGPTGG